jgi:hypothetical protein
MKSNLKRFWWLLLAVPLLAVLGFVAWAEIIPEPLPVAVAALEPDNQVSVVADPWLTFQPQGSTPSSGLIFYPGGRVDPRAYAPAARAIAEEGHLVVIVPMPLNLAVLGSGRAGEVIKAFPEVGQWAIGGHSLGGAMAAQYTYEHPEQIQGLVLWASYPPSGADLSGRDLPVVSIYGTLDGLASQKDVEGSRALLPSGTQWALIEGGNHAQFGWYGPQSGDNPATISPESQQEQIVAATLRLLEEIAD